MRVAGDDQRIGAIRWIHQLHQTVRRIAKANRAAHIQQALQVWAELLRRYEAGNAELTVCS